MLELMPKLFQKRLRLRRSAPRRDRRGGTIKNENRSGAVPHQERSLSSQLSHL